MTADGSEDGLIKPEGLKSYIVPPPALLEPSVSLPQAEEISVIGEDRVVDEAGPNEQEDQEYNSLSQRLWRTNTRTETSVTSWLGAKSPHSTRMAGLLVPLSTTVLIRLQADLGYKPRPQTSHAKN